MKPNMLKFILLMLLASFAASCAKTPETLRQGSAFFEFVKYTGNDAFFNENPLSEGQFYNPILSGFFPDPSVVRKGNDFYMVHSTFSFFPGIPIFHSTDLVNWRQIGHVLDRPSQLMVTDHGVSRGIFAPEITYNPHNDMFYVATTFVDGGGNFIVTAKDPAGPWSDPIWIPEVPGIDPAVFFDDDGRAYVLNNQDPDYPPLYEGHKAIGIQEFDVVNQRMIGPRRIARDAGHDITEKPIWLEAPQVFRLHGFYYMIAAEGGTSINHSAVVFRSKNIWGPWETFEGNPILTQRHLDPNRPNPVTNAGHSNLVQDAAGNWWVIFLGCRPYTPQNHFNIGRETFLMPVRWTEDKWPVVLEGEETVPLIQNLPQGVVDRQHEEGFMKRGNFSFVENFDSDELPMEWFFLRTPLEKWHELNAPEGGIWIQARPYNLRERNQPSFIGTRQRHHTMAVETRMHYMPETETDLAGLVLFQNEAHHITLGVTKRAGENTVILQKSERMEDGSVSKIEIAHQTLPRRFRGEIDLKAEMDQGKLSFSYRLGGRGNWTLLQDAVDARYLSTAEAQGFIGTIIALYASSNE